MKGPPVQLNSDISAIVTGGTSGLGEATARALASAGVKVTLLGRDDARGRRIAGEIGGLFVGADLTREAEVEAAFQTARAAQGQERILVNCAGTSFPTKIAWRDRHTGAVARHPSAAFDFLWQANVSTAFQCTAISAAGMIELPDDGTQERGVIVNTASIAAEDGQAGQSAYAAAKAAVAGMTLPLARDLAPHAIRVNCILPGLFDTPLMRLSPEPVREKLVELTPHPKRLGQSDEFAGLVLEVCRNTYMNGANLRLDAGMRMPPR